MGAITRERRLEILQDLGSTTCESCGGPKQAKRSHCPACYFKLPTAVQKALYAGFGAGYEEAYEFSLRLLRKSAQSASAQPTCRRCPAPIIFAQQNTTAKNPSPSNNPLNAKPHPNGNLRLDLATMKYDVLTGDELKAARARGEQLYLSHFADCPFRQKFRKQSAEVS